MNRFYCVLKEAMYTPVAPPTREEVDKGRSWGDRNVGLVTSTAVPMLAGTSMAAPLLAGLGMTGVGLPAAIGLGAAGMMYDWWRGNRAYNQAQQKWQVEDQQRENEAVHNGSMYGGDPNSMSGFIADYRQMAGQLPQQPAPQPAPAPKPAPQPAPVPPAAPVQPAAAQPKLAGQLPTPPAI